MFLRAGRRPWRPPPFDTRGFLHDTPAAWHGGLDRGWMWYKPGSQNSAEHSGSGARIATGTFQSEGDEFRIDVPEGWKQSRDGDGWEFVNASGKDQVLVTVLTAKKALSLEEAKAALARTVEARQQAIRDLSRGLARLVPVRNQTSDKAAAMSLVGGDPVNSVLIYTRIIATPWRVVTASYNGYGLGNADASAFAERAEPICESLRASEQPRKRRLWPWA